jgi:hypothetical protein
MEEIMKNDNKNDRRNFLKAAGAALVALSVPVAVAAQKEEPRLEANNLKQMIIFGGVSEPNPELPGVFGQACIQFQMRAEIGGRGFGTLSDPVFSDVNSRIEIHSGRSDLNDLYIFQGAISHSLSPEMVGSRATINVKVLRDGNCNVSLTIETANQAILIALLLPAVQKIR